MHAETLPMRSLTGMAVRAITAVKKPITNNNPLLFKPFQGAQRNEDAKRINRRAAFLLTIPHPTGSNVLFPAEQIEKAPCVTWRFFY